MHWQFTPYEIPYAIAAAISLWLVNVAWWRRFVLGAIPFGLLMFAVAEWSLGIVLALGNAGFPIIIIWNNVPLLGMVIVPAALLAFSLQYTGRSRWLSVPVIVLLTIEPLITLLLVWTNSSYGLIANSTTLNRSAFLFSTGCHLWLMVLDQCCLFLSAGHTQHAFSVGLSWYAYVQIPCIVGKS